VIGELVALTDDGRTPLVVDPAQRGMAAWRARSVIDLHGAHIGQRVVLMFEHAEPDRPIVIGVLHSDRETPLPEQSGQLEVSSHGQRLIVAAPEQLVLRCGKASITLTRNGKILIEGAYVLSRSTGVNRIKGGSVQLN
jgi:hypothetical protein